MDILNWLYLAKNKFVRTTLGSEKDLMIFGSKVGFNKRGDLYQNYAMSVEDFTAAVVPTPTYKVYTALLTQSGGDDTQVIFNEDLTIGVTYLISYDGEIGEWDFTNVGAPNNLSGTYFVATGTTPNSWGGIGLLYNTGAPVVTVLENTIGNIYWTYSDVGYYLANLNGAFTEGKTIAFFGAQQSTGDEIGGYPESINYYAVYSWFEGVANDGTSERPIEIRVYN